MTALDKFKDDIRNNVLRALPHDPSDDPELAAMDTTSLLITYINWARRFPTVRPRQVLESVEILANPLRTSAEYGTRYVELVDKIRRGDDLKDRLSRRVGTGYKTPTPGRYNENREALDLLLNDWDIHHLHFDPAGMEMLLFVQFMGDVAYLVNIYDHNSWTKQEIAEIIIGNWPTSDFVREVRSVTLPGPNPSDAERAMLRNNGIVAPFIGHKGKAYMLGTAGVTSAGTSTFATIQGQWLMKTLAEWNAAIASDPDYIPNKIRDAGQEPKATLDLEFVFMPNQHFGIGERNSGVLFRLTEGLA